LDSGLLIVPQGIGAAFGMNIGGRLTDHYGGGRVIPFGLLSLALGTLPFALVNASTPYWLLGLGLVLRGFGLGGSMMPAMAAAYATLERHQVPRATPMLNVLQRVGGSLGVAIFTVILQNSIRDAHSPGGTTTAFAHTYRWVVIAALIALLPAVVLLREEARVRREGKAGQAQPPQPIAA
jgi:MFS family permease